MARSVRLSTLAPQLKAQPEIKPDNISEDRVVADVAAMAERGERPFIIMDKDGTITLRNVRIEPLMAEHIVNLLAYGCRMVLISANVMSRIKPEFVDILINDTLQAINVKRRARGQEPYGKEIFKNLIVCTNAKVWEFNVQANDYLLQDSFTTDPVYYKQVKTILNIARNFFLSHPRYKLASTSHVRDIDGNLKLAALSKTVSRPERYAFIKREKDTIATLGYEFHKKLTWILVLQDILGARLRNQQAITVELLESYAGILASDKKPKRPILEALLDSSQMKELRESTLARFMLEMLDITDGNCRVIDTINQRIQVIKDSIDALCAPQNGPQTEAIRQSISDMENLYDYWSEMLNDIKNPAPAMLLKHRMSALAMARALAMYRGGPTDGNAPATPFVEDGGDFAVNVNFRNKGQRIDMLIKEFKVPTANTSYLGDELYETGGDATAFESQVETFINVGDPLDAEQIRRYRAPSHLCNPPGKTGPPAIERIFGRFLEVLELSQRQEIESTA